MSGNDLDIVDLLNQIKTGKRLSRVKFTALFDHMISGDMADQSIADALRALEAIGIGSDELEIGANALRIRMKSLNAPTNTIDIVGTGGDGLSTYNISTAACFVVAGAGVPVAKHGNRAVSSKSGASDVLRELGVKLDISLSQTEACIQQTGVGFLFAPNHHRAMGQVAKARQLLGERSIFNRLGPLCNPANVQYLSLGVFQDELRDLYAKALLGLGTKRALIAHGSDGMDEITTTASTMISELDGGTISEYQITPEEFGLNRAKLSDLEGGDPDYNAKALRDLLSGQVSAYRDIVVLNSGAALYVAGQCNSIKDGVELAHNSIDKGKAKSALDALITISNQKG